MVLEVGAVPDLIENFLACVYSVVLNGRSYSATGARVFDDWLLEDFLRGFEFLAEDVVILFFYDVEVLNLI